MSYFNIGLIFLALPILIIIYNIMPKKIRPILLLIFSLGFFFFISKWLVIFLVLSIISVYITAILLDKISDKRNEAIKNNPDDKKIIKKKYKRRKKIVLLLGILFNVSFLFYFKYLNFFETNSNLLFDLFNIDFHFKIVRGTFIYFRCLLWKD